MAKLTDLARKARGLAKRSDKTKQSISDLESELTELNRQGAALRRHKTLIEERRRLKREIKKEKEELRRLRLESSASYKALKKVASLSKAAATSPTTKKIIKSIGRELFGPSKPKKQ